jgi:hypothetical protein
MTLTFENDNDVIIFALEKVITYAKKTQQIIVAQCVWWLASIIALEQGLVNHIDNLEKRKNLTELRQEIATEASQSRQSFLQFNPGRVVQTSNTRAVSTTPRDLTEDQRLDRILECAERVIQESFRDRQSCQNNRVNPLPTTKTQLKKARKLKRLQESNETAEAQRSQRLREIRTSIMKNLSTE